MKLVYIFKNTIKIFVVLIYSIWSKKISRSNPISPLFFYTLQSWRRAGVNLTPLAVNGGVTWGILYFGQSGYIWMPLSTKMSTLDLWIISMMPIWLFLWGLWSHVTLFSFFDRCRKYLFVICLIIHAIFFVISTPFYRYNYNAGTSKRLMVPAEG